MNKTITKRVAAGTSIAALTLLAVVTNASSIKMDDVVNLGIDLELAVATALAEQPGDVIEVELEIERQRPIWEVEIVDKSNQVFEIEIDGITGEIVETERDNDTAPVMTNVAGLKSVIETVRTIEDGALIEIELENEDGTPYWKVTAISENSKKTKYRVNGTTGEIQS